jgi:hypothetical protein
VTATLTGLQQPGDEGVEVRIGESANVDFSMKVGAVSETVEVIGETPLVQATTSDVGQVITQKMVENIPLNGRKFQDLSLLVPGRAPRTTTTRPRPRSAASATAAAPDAP